MKKMLLTFLAVFLFLTGVYAATSQTININATIPAMSGGLNVTISRVRGNVFTPDTSLSFGTLIWDPVNSIFLPDSYFAVDIGVVDNTGTVWTVTHTRTSLASGINNLDNKFNVTFVKQTSSSVGQILQKLSYLNSQGVAYNKTQLAGGWLRIYYGAGTGDPANPDAPGVTPISLDSPAGTYSGTVTITLTP